LDEIRERGSREQRLKNGRGEDGNSDVDAQSRRARRELGSPEGSEGVVDGEDATDGQECKDQDMVKGEEKSEVKVEVEVSWKDRERSEYTSRTERDPKVLK
jgi:hypothetical protein